MGKKLIPCKLSDLAKLQGFDTVRGGRYYRKYLKDMGVTDILAELNIDLDEYTNLKMPIGVVWLLRYYIPAVEDIGNDEIQKYTIEDFFPMYGKKIVAKNTN